eukprot:CAMPEP_0181178524 /NCGR_PEP_ID=MMETSP1096-20121128/5767_2 /TAXON_ID=156174 ORGANISM="Chrysochromulina ericina, Strain CCMP281" /NCGR_SAMPLE_ID=MMETSP1096 /ASSEMBLY_ACC=CAM_ASM_000453 /LENGTH=179 /DNA_ID=CAMNT_0023266801 /DNA_START=194 /DNA_END=734 /DNA_ORIENTATION=-
MRPLPSVLCAVDRRGRRGRPVPKPCQPTSICLSLSLRVIVCIGTLQLTDPRQDAFPLEPARHTQLMNKVLIVELKQERAIDAVAGKGSDVFIETESAKPLLDCGLSPPPRVQQTTKGETPTFTGSADGGSMIDCGSGSRPAACNVRMKRLSSSSPSRRQRVSADELLVARALSRKRTRT